MTLHPFVNSPIGMTSLILGSGDFRDTFGAMITAQPRTPVFPQGLWITRLVSVLPFARTAFRVLCGYQLSAAAFTLFHHHEGSLA
jgi:hypothetical protein